MLVYLIWDAAIAQTGGQRICPVQGHEHPAHFENWLATKMLHSNGRLAYKEIYRIPVVVHVLHAGEPVGEMFNLSYEQVLSQIEVMNNDFRRKPGTIGYNDHPDGGDAGIEFVLASVGPDGEATNGIVRVDTSTIKPVIEGLRLASGVLAGAVYSIWPTDDYLNIWAWPTSNSRDAGRALFPVSDEIPGPGLEGNGYYFPGVDSIQGLPIEEVDGIIINSNYFGIVESQPKYGLGRTGTHEVGHFLGLYHVWGSSLESCDVDDYCDDTPLVSSPTYKCPETKMDCDGGRAMFENYMDYTDDACMDIFTNDQIFRMRTVLENSPRRKSLLTSKGLGVLDTSMLVQNKAVAFPNPFHTELKLWVANHTNRVVRVDCYDLAGSLLLSGVPYFVSNVTYGIRFTPEVPRGLYHLKVTYANEQSEWIKIVRR